MTLLQIRELAIADLSTLAAFNVQDDRTQELVIMAWVQGWQARNKEFIKMIV